MSVGFIPPDLLNALKKAAAEVRAHDTVRVLGHYDGDGTSAVIILTRALEREGIRYQAGFIKELDAENFRKRMMEAPDLFTIVVDAGSDQLRFVPDMENVLVLDHHFYNRATVKGMNINARDFGIDGTRGACGATMAFAFSLAMSEENSDSFPFMLSGAIADKQDIGGFTGLNRAIIEALGPNYRSIRGPNLEGETLAEAIAFSTDPFFRDLSGSMERTEEFLRGIGLDPARRLAELTEDEKAQAINALAAWLISQGAGSEAIRYTETDLYIFDQYGLSSKDISGIIDGNAKVGRNGVPVQFFLGDEGVRQEMLANWKTYKGKLIDYAYRASKEIFEEQNVRYFYAPESEMAGSIAGLLTLYVLPQDKPLIGFNVGDGTTKVSSRASRRLVERGLNLSTVMAEASREVGGTGGGHDIAAGASIPKGRERQFVEIVGRLVGIQLNGKAGQGASAE
ncbi:recombinase RecJ [Thermogymnomonas acidicola]|uniref:Recombinase RecJ n=1 Tax=Thermogymnomonas acidicola TaxID=399579 RepID=A0AA37BS19_9ARCH|nr:DHH family phosphoesterase [Thermogymnomonas acidicola]GGM73370.1 recombinase RecJ [Thermogymnomonas acidicola]